MANDSGTKIPTNIPGAPEKVTLGGIVTESNGLIRNSVDIFTRQPNALENEVGRATWWRYWLTLATGAVITATLYAVGLQLFRIKFGVGLDIGQFIFSLIFGTLIPIVAFFAGSYASHWYATTQQQGQATLITHSHTLATLWLPGTLLGAIIGFISLVLFDGFISLDVLIQSPGSLASAGIFLMILAIISIGIGLYSLWLMVGGIQGLYKFEGAPLWITVIVMLVASGVVNSILSSILPG